MKVNGFNLGLAVIFTMLLGVNMITGNDTWWNLVNIGFGLFNWYYAFPGESK